MTYSGGEILSGKQISERLLTAYYDRETYLDRFDHKEKLVTEEVYLPETVPPGQELRDQVSVPKVPMEVPKEEPGPEPKPETPKPEPLADPAKSGQNQKPEVDGGELEPPADPAKSGQGKPEKRGPGRPTKD
jgi:hypothetical protein